MAISSSMCSSFSALATLLLLTIPLPSHSLKASAISAAPAVLPTNPEFSDLSPALAPDIMPLFPTPGSNSGLAPSSSMPTIPSSPSPPNPDALEPNSAIAPIGAATSSASILGNPGRVSVALISCLVLMWWLELVGK
ncbi:uncharacterized protein [Typha latifolia]|uniref:uncharacterized protein n=1 Tax=Typha latifolia TaxID=4733 RepID=UPI003C30DA4A